MTHWLEAFPATLLASLLGVRRAWWAMCCAAGWCQGVQGGQTLSDKEAFALGRPYVIQTLAQIVRLRLHHVDWRALAAGTWQALGEWHLHAVAAAKGVVRDIRVFIGHAWAIIANLLYRRAKPTDAQRAMAMVDRARPLIGSDDGSAGHVVAANVEGLINQRRVTAAKIAAGTATKAEINEHTAISGFLVAHADEPPLAPLLGLPTSPISALPWYIAAASGAAFLAASGVAWERGARLDGVKAKLDTQTRELKAKTASLQTYTEVLARRDSDLTSTRAHCNTEIEHAQSSALKAKQAAATERKRHLHEQQKTLDSGHDVPLGDILRSLPGAVAAEPAITPTDPGPG